MTITTLIPAYKPKYIPELLLGLAAQTYQNFEVIISDDSPNGEVSAVLQHPNMLALTKNMKLRIVAGPKKGGYQNTYFLVRNYSQNHEFFHVLLDDDVIYPTFYEKHMHEHTQKEALLSVSKRWIANPLGQPFRQLMDEQTAQNFSLDFSSQSICKALLPVSKNKLGEWSHAVFKSEAAYAILDPNIGDICVFGIDDLVSFIKATVAKKGIYIPEALGFFRMHADQNTQQTQNHSIKCSRLAWIALSIAASEQLWIKDEQAWQCVSIVKNKIEKVYQQDLLGSKIIDLINQQGSLTKEFRASFLMLWNEYLQEIELDKILAGDPTIQLL